MSCAAQSSLLADLTPFPPPMEFWFKMENLLFGNPLNNFQTVLLQVGGRGSSRMPKYPYFLCPYCGGGRETQKFQEENFKEFMIGISCLNSDKCNSVNLVLLHMVDQLIQIGLMMLHFYRKPNNYLNYCSFGYHHDNMQLFSQLCHHLVPLDN